MYSKRIFALFIAIISLYNTVAQTTLTTAIDFSTTDINGTPFNLFSVLDSGKYVVIDFLYTTCVPCQELAPKLYGAFLNYGCNQDESQIVFVNINKDDDNVAMHNWEITYTSATPPYPVSISGVEGKGGMVSLFPPIPGIHSTYGISSWPTVILIAPDRSIIEPDMWPLTDASTFTTYFLSHGLNPMPCSATDVSSTGAVNSIELSPVPATDWIRLSNAAGSIQRVRIVNADGQVILIKDFGKEVQDYTISIDELTDGVYFTGIEAPDGSVITKKFVKGKY